MKWVVFLRAVNVGKANRCQPASIAKDLAKFGVINIGAVGARSRKSSVFWMRKNKRHRRKQRLLNFVDLVFKRQVHNRIRVPCVPLCMDLSSYWFRLSIGSIVTFAEPSTFKASTPESILPMTMMPGSEIFSPSLR